MNESELTTISGGGAAYGRTAQNRLSETRDPSPEGARAALESFYAAFNGRNLDLLRSIWRNDPLVQLNNPLGGIMRGIEPICELYARVFSGRGTAWVAFDDYIEILSPTTAVFAGCETGEFVTASEIVPLRIRTTRFFTYEPDGWRQAHHHGSIDDPVLLRRYQDAVAGA
jgi:hypothetical protein